MAPQLRIFAVLAGLGFGSQHLHVVHRDPMTSSGPRRQQACTNIYMKENPHTHKIIY